MTEKILSIHNLKTYFHTQEGIIKAVDGVSFDVCKGEILGLVGESGCGKSVTALSILRLIESSGKIIGGEIFFKGRNLLTLDDNELRKIRGNEISMIFQDPMTALNPVYTIGDQIIEVIELHQHLERKESVQAAINVIESVGLPEPHRALRTYPHELSGGMRQRVMIAIAISCEPSLLLADEPTTLLDVSVQAQILKLILGLREQINVSILFISHNLGVIANVCDRVAVMYAGNIVEVADVYTIFENPMHPYTSGLIKAVPKLDRAADVFETIPGTLPSIANFPTGCIYYPRCPYAEAKCANEKPTLRERDRGHYLSCFRGESQLSD